MLKTISNMLVGAFIAAMVSAAIAVTGTPPGTSFALQDGVWLNGLAGGLNRAYASGITAHAGGTQAAAFPLPPGIALIEVTTVASSADSVLAPQCLQGAEFKVYNASATTLNIYGQVAVNPVTGVADTINGTAGSTAYQLTTKQAAEFFCSKNGAWAAIKTG